MRRLSFATSWKLELLRADVLELSEVSSWAVESMDWLLNCIRQSIKNINSEGFNY